MTSSAKQIIIIKTNKNKHIIIIIIIIIIIKIIMIKIIIIKYSLASVQGRVFDKNCLKALGFFPQKRLF